MTNHLSSGGRTSSNLDKKSVPTHREGRTTNTSSNATNLHHRTKWGVDVFEAKKKCGTRPGDMLWKPPSRHEQKTTNSETREQKIKEQIKNMQTNARHHSTAP